MNFPDNPSGTMLRAIFDAYMKRDLGDQNIGMTRKPDEWDSIPRGIYAAIVSELKK